MQKLLTYLLYPVSLVYTVVIFFRNLFYDVQFYRVTKIPVPVISVGNITTGGTGKTPAVVYIAKRLQDDGFKVGIISRGYKRVSRGYVVVSDGKRALVNAEQGGDEPVMMANALPGVVIAVDENRVNAGKLIIEEYGVEVIIMDDGFQHRALHRDLDIVLINASRLDHLRAHLPVGRLRERLQSLRRADIVISTKYNDDTMLEKLEQIVHRYTPAVLLGSEIKPVRCYNIVDDTGLSLEDISSKTVYLVSGIAEPEMFQNTVKQLEISVCGTRWFPDHYHFNENDICGMIDEAKNHGADSIVTTEKDAVRLVSYKEMFPDTLPVYVLQISFFMNDTNISVLMKYLRRIMKTKKQKINTHN